MPEHAEQLVNHWYWRPGWRPGREFYTWHLTFNGEHDLHRLVSEYQEALRDVPGLDLVPLDWLHITMQGVGFVDEVPETDMRKIVDAVSARLSDLQRKTLRFQAFTTRPQAIALKPEPPDAVHDIRNRIRQGIADVWGESRVPESDVTFEPHLSVAYVNTDGPSTPVRTALSGHGFEPAEAVIDRAHLIRLRRHEHTYVWSDVAAVRLG
ncbi:2'-5' RNA ligase family protein [Actinosynnema sp. NPDC059797]